MTPKMPQIFNIERACREAYSGVITTKAIIMAWSKRAKKGAWGTVAGTILLTALSLIWLYLNTYGQDGVTPMSFLKIGIVIAIVWAAIGATMAFFIVMVLRKNEALDDRS